MKRYGYLARHFLSTALLALLAVFARLADAGEQEILPDVRWFSYASNVGQPSLEAAVADYNSYRASQGYQPIPHPQRCPDARVYNGLAVGYCWPEPDSNGNPQLVGFIGPLWECPAEAPTPVTKDLPAPLHHLLYCRASVAAQPPPPESCRDSCVGNPIQVNTQIKIQRDFDLGLGPLHFERVYTSSTGGWRHSFSTRAWNLALNNFTDLPSNPSPGCFWGTVSVNVPKQRVCLPYMSNSDLGRTGAADWMIQRADGRTVGISSASQRSIDAATRETAHAVLNGGNFEGLIVYDGSDTVEFFDRQGRLTRRSPLNGGGALLTYLTPTGQKHPSSAPDCVGLTIGPGTVGRPSCVTDAVTGRQLQFAYDSTGRMTSVTDPAGLSVSYQYNGPTSSGLYPGVDALTSVSYSDLSQRTYHYNESTLTAGANLPLALTGITDETNSRYSNFGYSASGAALATSHANGIGAYTITPSALLVTDALGRQTSYGSTILTKTASDGSIVSRTVMPSEWGIPLPQGGRASALRYYDAAGNLTQRSDHRGIVTRYEYDLLRNYEITRTEAYGLPKARKTSTAWHPQWHRPVIVAEPKRITWSIYNGQPDPTNGNAVATCAPSGALLDGQPIAVLCKRVQQATTDETGAAGFSAALVGPQRIWTYTYNENGQVLTVDGARTDVSDSTSYTYYSADDTQTPKRYRKGDLFSVTNALGHATTYESYNGNGQPLTISDANGLVTTLSYDLRDRLTSRTVGAEQTTFEYWPTGLLKKTTLPDGTYLEYVYDAAHRLTDVNDSEGNLIHYTLDAVGNRTRRRFSITPPLWQV